MFDLRVQSTMYTVSYSLWDGQTSQYTFPLSPWTVDTVYYIQQSITPFFLPIVSQVSPSWCLLSSTYQFENGIPKSINLSGMSCASAAATHLFRWLWHLTWHFLVNQFNATSSQYHQVPKIFQLFLALSSHFKPFKHF